MSDTTKTKGCTDNCTDHECAEDCACEFCQMANDWLAKQPVCETCDEMIESYSDSVWGDVDTCGCDRAA